MPVPQGFTPLSLGFIFDVRFLATLDSTTGLPRPALVAKLLAEECDGVYSFPLLKAEFCDNLVQCGYAFSAHFAKSGGEAEMPPRMLDLMDLGWLNDLLLHVVMNPLAQMTMQDQLQGEVLDYRHGYIVGYSPLLPHGEARGSEEGRTGARTGQHVSETEIDKEGGVDDSRRLEDKRTHYKHTRDHLVAHSDDAEATLNVGLVTDFVGGDLLFYGRRGSGDEGTPLARYRHPRKGHAVLHVGRQLHEVQPVSKGSRYGLIVWARSIRGVRQGVCPCCWMNGRDAVRSACICGPRWN